MFLPTLEEAQKIVQHNEAFETSSFEYKGYRVHNFGYRLPGFMDFEDPIPGSGLKAHELRGLTFVENPDGSVSRHLLLRKFHALNQTAGFMMKDIVGKPGKEIKSCSEKLDGSIVRFVKIGDEILARTKSSFYGPHARLSNELIAGNQALKDFIVKTLEDGKGAIFELVSPEWKIVIPYDEVELRLIQIREEATGELIDIANYPLVEEYAIKTALVDIKTIEDVIELQKTVKGKEGWVVLFQDNTLMKCKTQWYDDFHDFFFEKNRTNKKMVAMVVAETMDDALASMAEEDPNRQEAQEVFDLVSRYLNETADKITKTIADFPQDKLADNQARKAFTEQHKGDPLLGIYMQALKNPDAGNLWDLTKRFVSGQSKTEEDSSRLLRKLREQYEPNSENQPALKI